jgi:hypothetical protein
MDRLVSAGSIVYEQLDFFLPPGSTNRVTGIPAVNVSVRVFANNVLLPWSLIDGLIIPDSSVTSGSVYFNEISSNPGFYSVRIFPDRIGFWRLVFLNSTLSTEIIKEFDAIPPGVLRPSSGGLNASTSKSC